VLPIICSHYSITPPGINQLSNYAQHVLRAFGSYSTRFVGARLGRRAPYIYVCEFPKSGGTWLAKMISQYLQIRRAENDWFPPLGRSVVHNHWTEEQRISPAVYLYRDGRDACVSMYFHLQRRFARDAPGLKKKLLGRYPLFQRGTPSEARCRDQLAEFIELWRNDPLGSHVNWSEHIARWRPHWSVAVSYEELLEDCHGTMTRVLKGIGVSSVDTARLKQTINDCSFEKQTNRRRGEVDQESFIRKGIAGDWRNWFDTRSAALFDKYFGNTLVELGYEPDHQWVNCVAETTVSTGRTLDGSK